MIFREGKNQTMSQSRLKPPVLAALIFLIFTCSVAAHADPITIQNVRFASQNASENIVPILDSGTTSYTQFQGDVYIFFDVFGSTQGSIIGVFSGNLPLAQGTIFYFGTGQQGNPSTIGIHTLMGVGTCTGTVTFFRADGTPLFYIAGDGTIQTNPTFSIQVTALPAPAPVPEPATIVLLTTGLSLFRLSRKRKDRA